MFVFSYASNNRVYRKMKVYQSDVRFMIGVIAFEENHRLSSSISYETNEQKLVRNVSTRSKNMTINTCSAQKKMSR